MSKKVERGNRDLENNLPDSEGETDAAGDDLSGLGPDAGPKEGESVVRVRDAFDKKNEDRTQAGRGDSRSEDLGEGAGWTE